MYNFYLAVTDKMLVVENAKNIDTRTILPHKKKVENIRYYNFLELILKELR